jgi:hypothetical protein
MSGLVEENRVGFFGDLIADDQKCAEEDEDAAEKPCHFHTLFTFLYSLLEARLSAAA